MCINCIRNGWGDETYNHFANSPDCPALHKEQESVRIKLIHSLNLIRNSQGVPP